MVRVRYAKIPIFLLSLSSALILPVGAMATSGTMDLSSMEVKNGIQQWGEPKALTSNGNPQGGLAFHNAVVTNANSRLTILLHKSCQTLAGRVAIDPGAPASATAQFSIWKGDTRLWASPMLHKNDNPVPFSLNVGPYREVTLKVDRQSGTAFTCRCDWLDTAVTYKGRVPEVVDRPESWKRDFVPGAVWRDNNGVPIQAHGGGVLKVGNTWFWVGEDKSKGYNNFVGVHEYSSRDLIHWHDEGVVLPASSLPEEFRSTGVCERPKIIYNPLTKLYFMWMHLDAHRYTVSEAGLAIAPKVNGPFKYVAAIRPVNNSTFRDMNVFVDKDGSAYLIYAAENNATLYIVRLDRSYGAPHRPEVEGVTWARIAPGGWHEAPAMWRYGSTYYLIASHTTGWSPNTASLFTAKSPLGPWVYQGNPFNGPDSHETFYTQSTCVIPAPGHPGWFIYMGDRWNPADLGNSRYVWLPFHITKGSNHFDVDWRSHWNLKDLGTTLKAYVKSLTTGGSH